MPVLDHYVWSFCLVIFLFFSLLCVVLFLSGAPPPLDRHLWSPAIFVFIFLSFSSLETKDIFLFFFVVCGSLVSCLVFIFLSFSFLFLFNASVRGPHLERHLILNAIFELLQSFFSFRPLFDFNFF